MSKHGIIRLPRTPNEIQQCQTDGNKDTLKDAQQHHTQKAHNRKYKFFAPQFIKSQDAANFNQVDTGGNHDGAERCLRQVLQQSGSEDQ